MINGELIVDNFAGGGVVMEPLVDPLTQTAGIIITG